MLGPLDKFVYLFLLTSFVPMIVVACVAFVGHFWNKYQSQKALKEFLKEENKVE